jgi:hypothetical protein
MALYLCGCISWRKRRARVCCGWECNCAMIKRRDDPWLSCVPHYVSLCSILCVLLFWVRICKPFKEPGNWFPCCLAGRYDYPIWRTGPPGYIGWRNRFLAESIPWNRFLSFLYVYKYGLWILRRLLIRPQVLKGLKVQRGLKSWFEEFGYL